MLFNTSVTVPPSVLRCLGDAEVPRRDILPQIGFVTGRNPARPMPAWGHPRLNASRNEALSSRPLPKPRIVEQISLPENPALSSIYACLSEPSTWRGIIALVTAAGVALSPD
jgi:hypothetical protein